MLLHEIAFDTARMDKLYADDKVIGGGAQGVALPSNKPNTIRKVYGLNNTMNHYYRFIETIRQHQDNPFFPRIYRHDSYKNKPFRNPDGGASYEMTGVVMMEKLHPLAGKVPRELIITMFNRLGVNITEYGDLGSKTVDPSSIQRIAETTTNKEFAEALNVLLSLKTHFFDLHFNNWMVRLTSVGPQLVILDPVF